MRGIMSTTFPLLASLFVGDEMRGLWSAGTLFDMAGNKAAAVRIWPLRMVTTTPQLRRDRGLSADATSISSCPSTLIACKHQPQQVRIAPSEESSGLHAALAGPLPFTAVRSL